MVQIINKGTEIVSVTVSQVLRMIIRCYQLLISPFLPNVCRFYPSCSQYTLLAVAEYGSVKGMLKSLNRLFRCHPWSAGGYDPVLPNQEKS